MKLERSEFNAVSNGESHFIYVFGGTIQQEDKRVIERYNCMEDEWETLSI